MLRDILGRPITKGDVVLTKGYNTAKSDTIATVEKVTKINIYVNIPDRWAEWYNNRYPNDKQKPITKRMARMPSECIVINEQLDYTREHYPELFV